MTNTKTAAATFTVTLTLPAKVFLRNVGGEAINWDVAACPESVLARIVEIGGKTVLTNAFNGGGKDATDSEKLAAVQKKMDAWKRGEFIVVERGDSQLGLMREVYTADVVAKTGTTVANVEKHIKATVAAIMGDKAKATFGNFLTALAKAKAKADDSIDAAEYEAALTAKLEARAAELAQERAKATLDIDLAGLDF